MNCPNCGAIVKGDICEYCGTVFRQPRNEMNVEIEMKCDPEEIFKVMRQHVGSYRNADGTIHREVFE